MERSKKEILSGILPKKYPYLSMIAFFSLSLNSTLLILPNSLKSIKNKYRIVFLVDTKNY